MRNDTRGVFNAYCADVARLNGIPDATQKFAVAPTVEQTLENRIQQSAEFLQRVNVTGVAQPSGQVLGLGTTGPIAGRTDTTTAPRQPRDIHGLGRRDYQTVQTNFDSFIRYDTLDAWAKFPDFQTRVRNKVVEQIARDRLTIGWNGTHAAATTDPVANKLLQDVNVGWLEYLRVADPGRVFTGPKVGEQAGADYKTLDGLIFDAVNSYLDDWYKDDPNIIAICGRSLYSERMLGLIEVHSGTPTEAEALKTMQAGRAVGGKTAQFVPFFPTVSILLANPKNLSIYWQTGTRRRQIDDQPSWDRIVDFQSVNEGYVIEDTGACCLIEGIQVPDGAGGWA
ncbi:phage major capsid protein, P2 family [Roseospira marina]|uniref:Phage major capsid protein, P2 family n=1 Tax=Roseospira marina TaxID=140057 RepID=A0A5M6I6A7_9PROT|nr:phage major capsid protein, P2 family [Roseospira marina]KAA5603781.1 phage major capsid protein, P2 family [Roseospira marina]MBB4316093.1 P2 family phage major capsid protein [Roseospira marina]MBB5089259.1 P2 family phage major capsid protein [Roseospira marina]